jgi:hypothetical protein
VYAVRYTSDALALERGPMIPEPFWSFPEATKEHYLCVLLGDPAICPPLRSLLMQSPIHIAFKNPVAGFCFGHLEQCPISGDFCLR